MQGELTFYHACANVNVMKQRSTTPVSKGLVTKFLLVATAVLMIVSAPITTSPRVSADQFDDQIRREIARRALEKLLKDPRIQPFRIEEIVLHTKKEVEKARELTLASLN